MLEELLNKATLGDSYELIKQIPDNSIDLICTDIPYEVVSGGVCEDGLGGRKSRQRIDLLDTDVYNSFDINILDEFVRVMKKVNIFIWCSKLQLPKILNYFMKIKDVNYDILTWHKTNPSPLINMTYLSDTEYCLSFREKGVVIKGENKNRYKYWVTSLNKNDKDTFEHQTIKPLKIIKQLIINTTDENDIVADFFGGSGTTGEACIELNRQFVLIENNPKWHKVSVDRLNGITASGQYSIFGNNKNR